MTLWNTTVEMDTGKFLKLILGDYRRLLSIRVKRQHVPKNSQDLKGDLVHFSYEKKTAPPE